MTNEKDYKAIIDHAWENTRKDRDSRSFRELASATRELSEVHRKLAEDLEKERSDRSVDDKRYFWLGVLFSALIAFTVEYLPEILGFLQSLSL